MGKIFVLKHLTPQNLYSIDSLWFLLKKDRNNWLTHYFSMAMIQNISNSCTKCLSWSYLWCWKARDNLNVHLGKQYEPWTNHGTSHAGIPASSRINSYSLGMVIHNINKGINKSINGTGLLGRTFYLAPQLYFKVTCTCELTMLRLTNISFSQGSDANLTCSSLKITCPAFSLLWILRKVSRMEPSFYAF